MPPDGRLALLFIAVPEQKHVKNRGHLDVVPGGRATPRPGLGARMAEDHRRTGGTGWVVLADLEGNELRVDQSDDDRRAGGNQFGRAFAAVGDLITNIQPEQWSATATCTDRSVRQLVDHLTGMNDLLAHGWDLAHVFVVSSDGRR